MNALQMMRAKNLKIVVAISAAFALGLIAGQQSLFTNAFAENQPQMQAALNNLQQAKTHLQSASHDKGGHRTKALNHTNTAIAQVRKGINYDNTH
jgi:outer membrane lipoprotein-sorting protein